VLCACVRRWLEDMYQMDGLENVVRGSKEDPKDPGQGKGG
jgi:hypothetical protein